MGQCVSNFLFLFINILFEIFYLNVSFASSFCYSCMPKNMMQIWPSSELYLKEIIRIF